MSREPGFTGARRDRGSARGTTGRTFTALTLLALGLSGCAPAGPDGGPISPSATEGRPYLVSEPDPQAQAWIERTLTSLDLREAVGQLVFPWLSGAYAAEDDPELLEAFEWVERSGIGGVVISIGTPLAYAAKLNALQGRADIPLLVTSDFENGGPGMRINHTYALPTLLPQGGGTSFPPTMAFGAVGDERAVERFARITALEARAVGVHLNFAPVLDVNSNPENPIINTRAFGESPDEVARLGRAYIRGARQGGVLTTAKHFPGHGDTQADSHLGLPAVTADRERLDQLELIPFHAALDEGVDAVMTAHVAVPGILGPDAPPATLSPEFMTELLREEMGFSGLLFTDALRMGAITDGYGAGEAAVLALEAGADAIVVPESVPASIEAVVEAVQTGRVSRRRIDQSVRRILTAKTRVGLNRSRMVSLDAVSRVAGVAEHRGDADDVAARSITLPRDREALIPLDPERFRRVLSVTYASSTNIVAGAEFDGVLRGLVSELETVRIGPETPENDLTQLLERAASFDVVLVSAYVPPQAGASSVALPDPVQSLIRALDERGPTALVSLGNPYLLNAVPSVGTYLVAWGDREVSQRAAARAVAGAEAISGRLPITLPELHERGEGLDREAIPAIAALEDRRRDLLEEAGFVRGDPDDDPDDADDPAVGPDPPGRPVPQGPDGVGLGTPRIPEGVPAPGGWRGLDASPLEAAPTTVGMDAAALEALDSYIVGGLADSVAPGAALAIARRGKLVRLRGYGRLDWDPESAAVTPFALYDLASLTKVLGTTTAIMVLADEGVIDLDDPVIDLLSEFARGDAQKSEITIRDLLLHQAGFPPFRTYFEELEGLDAIRDAVYETPLEAVPRSQTVYSDIGFMVLGWVVEAASGETLDSFLERRVFRPLGMVDTGFNPELAERIRIAPTERDTAYRPYLIVGEVHDENAHAMSGVAGHAGLFSSVQDLAVLVSLLLNEGMLESCDFEPGSGIPCGARSAPIRIRFLEEETVRRFTTGVGQGSSRALGWDTPSGRSSSGDYFSARSYGHTGFTGTSVWIDPELELAVILLTNRVNPTRENTRHIAFRRAVHDLTVAAISDLEVAPRDRR